MTVPTIFVPLSYSGSGVAGPFSVPYQFGEDEFLQVGYTDITGTTTILTLDIDYTVSGAGTENGGSVTLTQPLMAGERLYIDLGGLQPTQLTDWINGGIFDLELMEDDLDKSALIDQKLFALTNRAVRPPDGELGFAPLPDAGDRANGILGFDANGNPVIVSQDGGLGPALGSFSEAYAFVGDGVTTSFIMDEQPPSPHSAIVTIDGVFQHAPAWTTNGVTLVFDEPPALGANIQAVIVRAAVMAASDGGSVTYIPGGGGAVIRTVEARLRDIPTTADYGIVGGVDETAKFQTVINSGRSPVIATRGNYTVATASLTGMDRASGAAFIGLGATFNGLDSKHGLRGAFFGADGLYFDNYDIYMNDGWAGGVSDNTGRNLLTLTAETLDTADDQDNYKTPLSVIAKVKGGNFGTAAKVSIINESDNVNGIPGLYCEGWSYGDAFWTAPMHSELRHGGGAGQVGNFELSTFNATGNVAGITVNNVTGGAGKTEHPVTAAPAVLHPSAAAVKIIANGTATGKWAHGVRIHANSLQTTGRALFFQSAGAAQMWTDATASSSTADIYLQGDSAYGTIYNGTYTSGTAIRMSTGSAIAFDTTNSIKQYYESATSRMQISHTGNIRMSFEIDPDPRILFNGVQVLGEPGAAIADAAPNIADVTAKLNFVLARMRAGTPTIQT